jgi:hypothetical protein
MDFSSSRRHMGWGREISETECQGMASLPRVASRAKVIEHPVEERDAAVFHAILAGIGLLHIIGGAAMIYFHGVSAQRHFRDSCLQD